MDPLTHALVGVGVAALAGDNLSVGNPVFLGTVLGALAPDLDIILQLYGDVPYLTHHRGSSHSVTGVIISSAVITAALWSLLGGNSIGAVFVWTMLGSVSHIVLDILNSYGAKIFWPFSHKKYTLNLLVLADPIIIGIFAGVIFWPGIPGIVAKTAFWLALVYLGIRLYMKSNVYRLLWRTYGNEGIKRVVVMPAMVSLWNWSFLVETQEKYIIGEVRCFSWNLGIKKILEKGQANIIVRKALNSKLGRIFQNFTPYFHIHHCIEDGKHVVRFCDLRYYFREDFLHNGKVVFDETENIVYAVFQPYSRNRKIKVMG